MEKTQVYFRKEELDALREAARRSGRSVADLVREAIRNTVLKPAAAGPRRDLARRAEAHLG